MQFIILGISLALFSRLCCRHADCRVSIDVDSLVRFWIIKAFLLNFYDFMSIVSLYGLKMNIFNNVLRVGLELMFDHASNLTSGPR